MAAPSSSEMPIASSSASRPSSSTLRRCIHDGPLVSSPVRHAGAAQMAQQLDRVLDEARAAELLVAQARGGRLQRLRRLAPRLADGDQVQAPVAGDVELAAEHALVEVVAAVAEARAQVVELDARQLLVDRGAQPDEHLGLEARRVEQRVVEVEDDRARQVHAQRSPGSLAGYRVTGSRQVQRGAQDAVLLAGVGGGIALARRGALGPADVAELQRAAGRICMSRGDMWARAPMLRGSSWTHTTSRRFG